MVKPEKIFGRLGNSLFQYAYIYSKFLDKEISDIYLQDYGYFDHHREELRKLFGENIKPVDAIAVHVRRGDYVGNPFYVDLVANGYYEVALKEFIGPFVFVSDDIAFCKERFPGHLYAQGINVISDLNLMAGCKGIIMANSSLSWWGAYLGNEDRKVVAPAKWYSDGITRTKLLPEWKTL